MNVRQEERAKVAFINEYRTLCERHGLIVIRVENDGEYWAFAVGRPDTRMLNIAIQEMLLEPVREVVHGDSPK